MDARQVEVQGELERLCAEVEELRASRRRLVAAADADRRRIERDLHDGVHQRLVAVAVSLQLAGQAAGADPGTASAHLDELHRDVQDALDETARLAQRIHPASLRERDLGALLRSAATDAGIPAAVDVSVVASCLPEAVMTVYLSWLEVLASAGGGARTTIDVHERDDALLFEITGGAAVAGPGLDRCRDRVEALGGGLTVTPVPDGGTRLSGALPVSR